HHADRDSLAVGGAHRLLDDRRGILEVHQHGVGNAHGPQDGLAHEPRDVVVVARLAQRLAVAAQDQHRQPVLETLRQHVSRPADPRAVDDQRRATAAERRAAGDGHPLVLAGAADGYHLGIGFSQLLDGVAGAVGQVGDERDSRILQRLVDHLPGVRGRTANHRPFLSNPWRRGMSAPPQRSISRAIWLSRVSTANAWPSSRLSSCAFGSGRRSAGPSVTSRRRLASSAIPAHAACPRWVSNQFANTFAALGCGARFTRYSAPNPVLSRSPACVFGAMGSTLRPRPWSWNSDRVAVAIPNAIGYCPRTSHSTCWRPSSVSTRSCANIARM